MNPFRLHQQTVRIPIQLITSTRNELVHFMSTHDLSLRDHDLLYRIGVGIDNNSFFSVSTIAAYLPEELRTTSTSAQTAYNAIPQLIGSVAFPDYTDEGVRRSISEYVRSKTVSNIQQFLILLYEIDQYYKIAEGESFSDSDQFAVSDVQISLTQLRHADYSARTFLRGRCSNDEDVIEKVELTLINNESCKVNVKLRSFASTYHCALTSILHAINMKFVDINLTKFLDKHSIPLCTVDAYLKELPGVGELEMCRVLHDLSANGTNPIFDGNLLDFFTPLIIYKDNGLVHARKTQVKRVEETRKRKRGNYRITWSKGSQEMYLALYNSHWWVIKSKGDRVFSKMLKKNTLSLRESDTKYVFPIKPPQIQIAEPTSVILPLEDYFEMNSIKKTIIYEAMSNYNPILLIGPAGSGKSHMIMDLAEKLDGEITSRDAFITREVYNKGSTLHHLFNNFKAPTVKSKLHSNCKFLFIDEISNMRYSWVDYIDQALRLSHDSEKPFGGVTILWSGDFMQLQPILHGRKVSESLDTKIFLHPSIGSIIRNNMLFDIKSPIRFLLSSDYPDKEKYASAMEYLRHGKVTLWLKDQVEKARVPYKNASFVPDEVYSNLSSIPMFICLRNAACFRLHQTFAEYHGGISIANSKKRWPNAAPAPSRANLADNAIALFPGCPILITCNQAKTSPPSSAVNGTLAYFIEFTEEGLSLRHSVTNLIFMLKPFAYRNKARFPIKPSIARTVHSCQGMTFDNVYLYFGKLTDSVSGSIQQHQIYVAISRAKKLTNFKWYCSENILTKISVDKLSDRFSSDPESTIFPMARSMSLFTYKKEYKEYACNVNQDGRLQMYTVKDVARTKDGYLMDAIHCENSLYTKHTIIFDKETCTLESGKLFAYGISFKYYHNGLQPDPSQLWGIQSNYIRNSCTSTMYMQWKQGSSPQRDFTMFFMSIIGIIRHSIQSCPKYGSASIANLFKEFPIYLCGYNINGFDLYGLLEELISKDELPFKFELGLIKTHGSSNKGFSIYCEIRGKRKCVLVTHDIREIINVGSLENQINDWVLPYMKKTESEFAEGVLTSIERRTLNTPLDQLERNLRFEASQDLGNMPETKKSSFMERHLAPIRKFYEPYAPKFNYRHLYTVQIKKGCPPLKLMDQYNTIDKFTSLIGKRVNVWELILQGTRWDLCFYPREIKKAQEYFTQEMLESYDLLNEIAEYAMADTDLTDLLYRVLNNVIYTFGSDTDHPSFRHPSGIQGCRSSVLRFKTACSITGYLSALFLPKEIKTHSGNEIQTELPLYDERAYHLIRRHPGGKVLPRYFTYKSIDWENDYKVYLDISGMYAAAMSNCSYPYGRFNILRSPIDDEELNIIKDNLNNNEQSKQMWIGIVVRSMHPEELDPPCGVKLPKNYGNTQDIQFTKRSDLLSYRNDPVPSVETNISCEDIIRSGGKIHKIHHLIRWEFEDNLISQYITYLTKGKDLAQEQGQKAKRAFFKLLSNAEYGNMGKQNYSSKCVVIQPEDRVDFEAQLCNGDYAIRFEELDNGNVIYNYEDMTFTQSDRPTHLSAFVLSHSKRLMNRAIEVVFGKDRHEASVAEKLCPMYGDTDSVVISKEGIERIVAHDIISPLENQILYYSSTPPWMKLGKFTDELADKHYVNASFPDFTSNFTGRVVEMYAPQPKTYACKYIIPPSEYQGQPTSPLHMPPTSEWSIHYKFCAKGVPKDASIEPAFRSEDSQELKDKWQRKMEKYGASTLAGDNVYTFQCIKFCVQNNIPLRSSKDKIERHLDCVNGEKRYSMYHSTLERTILNHPWGGRERLYRVLGMNQESLLDMTESVVPIGFSEWPYSEEEIEKANESAQLMCSLFT
jgi:hypothetical protein